MNVNSKIFKINLFLIPVYGIALLASYYSGMATLDFPKDEANAHIYVLLNFGVYFFPAIFLIAKLYKIQYGEYSDQYNSAPAGAFGIFIFFYLLLTLKFASTLTYALFSWQAENTTVQVRLEYSYPSIERSNDIDFLINPFFSVELESGVKLAICKKLYRKFAKNKMREMNASIVNFGKAALYYVPCDQ